jgi:hypothetical protein
VRFTASLKKLCHWLARSFSRGRTTPRRRSLAPPSFAQLPATPRDCVAHASAHEVGFRAEPESDSHCFDLAGSACVAGTPPMTPGARSLASRACSLTFSHLLSPSQVRGAWCPERALSPSLTFSYLPRCAELGFPSVLAEANGWVAVKMGMARSLVSALATPKRSQPSTPTSSSSLSGWPSGRRDRGPM